MADFRTAILSAGYGVVQGVSMTVAKNLGSASLSATVPVYDRVSGETVDVAVELSWTATGSAKSIDAPFVLPTDEATVSGSFSGKARPASAAGSLSGVGIEHGDGSAAASIQSVKAGVVFIG
ncbi:MAG: hypothetical protein QOJ59_4609 [Thermomicrobiales bacterium]|jgi:hypothetical protein|nr:hypothetical protein [Thermomicrobiales bacterium]